ncbi:MAG: hypothetical protein NUV56_01025 [Candidatus Uhrbacteria bacterium]|nr:hypothetical protein [Candidatus Uhrbacteria bacterium]
MRTHQVPSSAAKRLVYFQQIMDEAMVELKTLDFADPYSVVLWIESIRRATDFVGVACPVEEIVSVFARNGYKPSDVREIGDWLMDERISARHIILNSLVFLSNFGIIHQVVDHMIEQFRATFPATTDPSRASARN